MPPRPPRIPYSHDDLYAQTPHRTYTGEQLTHLAFPLGGIGTGALTLNGYGKVSGAGLFDETATGSALSAPGAEPAVVFALATAAATSAGAGAGARSKGSIRLLQGAAPEAKGSAGASMPRFSDVAFEAAYPFARLRLTDKTSPLAVMLEAWSPYVPLDPEASALPAACFHVHLTNTSKSAVAATLHVTLRNLAASSPENGSLTRLKLPGLTGVQLATAGAKGNSKATTNGRSLVLATPFADAALPENADAATAAGVAGGLSLTADVAPGATVVLPLWITWHATTGDAGRSGHEPCHYRERFADAAAVAAHLVTAGAELERLTRRFAEALHASTVPAAVRDVVAASLSTLKLTTHPQAATATVPWLDQQALAWIFPRLDRSHREARFVQAATGQSQTTLATPVDAHLTGILEVYRDWLLAGDDAWLRACWPRVQQVLADTWALWDADRDGLMEAAQTTVAGLDLRGPNTVAGSVYLAALRAAEEMALQLDENDSAELYREVFEQGRAWMDAVLFNGQYFTPYAEPWPREDGTLPDLPPGPAPCLNACLADQMLGQWHANILKLGHLFDRESVTGALASTFVNNWQPPSTKPTRGKSAKAKAAAAAAANLPPPAESGLRVAVWPKGNAPEVPLAFAEQVRRDSETQVACQLMTIGLIDEGLAIIQAQSDRYDGRLRNPWDPGTNASDRSTASFTLLLTLADFFYSAPSQSLHLAPRVFIGDFSCLFVVPGAWGTATQGVEGEDLAVAINVLQGELTLANLSLGLPAVDATVTHNDMKQVARGEATDVGCLIRFETPITIKAGDTLRLALVLPESTRADADDFFDDEDDADDDGEMDEDNAGEDDESDDDRSRRKVGRTARRGAPSPASADDPLGVKALRSALVPGAKGISRGIPVSLAPEVADELADFDVEAAMARLVGADSDEAVDEPRAMGDFDDDDDVSDDESLDDDGERDDDGDFDDDLGDDDADGDDDDPRFADDEDAGDWAWPLDEETPGAKKKGRRRS